MKQDELLDELTHAVDVVLHAEQQWPFGDWQGVAAVSAAGTLARHVQRLYDPTPVDEAFAKAVAADGITGTTYFHIAERERDCVTLVRWSGGYHLKCGGFSVSQRATRGDVRRLCDVLGIDLREEP